MFDVGANAGALTLAMSRLVGPRGIVCAFEASPRIVDKCLYNLTLNGCTNVQLYQRAVYHSSNEAVKIYAGAHLNDSLLADRLHTGGESFDVKTIALDDFVEYTDLTPTLIKMDIEGAEFEALRGMERTIARARPHLILEQQPDDMRCHQLLTRLGYTALDLATYKTIETAADSPEVAVANILFIHHSRLDETPYRPPVCREVIKLIGAEKFSVTADGSRTLKEPLQIGPGRFIFDVDFTAQRTDNELFAGVTANQREIFRYHTNSHFLSTSYRQWVVNLEQSLTVSLFFRFLNGTRDETLDVKGVTIYGLPSFRVARLPLVD